MSVIDELYSVILEKKNDPAEGSYTSYLFSAGTDKILKKIGEESAETIIAAKNEGKEELVGEICDLTYHLLVLMAQKGIDPGEIERILKERRQKIGNLKQFKNTDKNT